MAEQSVCASRAVVYYFDSTKKNWANSPVTGYARLDIYKNSSTGAFRVIGRGIEDANAIVINSPLSKDTVYVRSQEQFHQFQDPRYLYGLNFATPQDALSFGTEFEKAVTGLKGGHSAPTPPQAKPAAVSPVASPALTPAKAAAAPPSSGPSKPPPMPPKAPPKPPPVAPRAAPASDPAPDDDPSRNALLNSIQGFAKNKLKKADTVDKSGPLIAAKPPESSSEASPARAAGPPGKASLPDLAASVMAKRAAMQQKAPSSASNEIKSVEPKKPPVPALKQASVVTKQESKPPAPTRISKSPRDDSPPPSVLHSHSTTSTSSALPEHLQALKEEILAEVRSELAQMKIDIINAIRSQ